MKKQIIGEQKHKTKNRKNKKEEFLKIMDEIVPKNGRRS